MNVLRAALILLSVLVVAVLGAGLLLPSQIRVTRAIHIEAPIQRVFSILNSFEEFNDWSPWYELDPQANYRTSGEESGVGARFEWTSGNTGLGNGSQQIIQSEPFERVQVEMMYGSQSGFSTYQLQATEDGTQLDWQFESDLGQGLFSAYVALIVKSGVARDCEKGLQNLKRLAEASLGDSEGLSLKAALVY